MSDKTELLDDLLLPSRKKKSMASRIADERLALSASKRKTADMLYAKARNELILKTLVEDQARYLLVVFRRRALLAPAVWAGKVYGLGSEEEVREVLLEGVRDLLLDLRDLPRRISDPEWAEKITGEEAE